MRSRYIRMGYEYGEIKKEYKNIYELQKNESDENIQTLCEYSEQVIDDKGCQIDGLNQQIVYQDQVSVFITNYH